MCKVISLISSLPATCFSNLKSKETQGNFPHIKFAPPLQKIPPSGELHLSQPPRFMLHRRIESINIKKHSNTLN